VEVDRTKERVAANLRALLFGTTPIGSLSRVASSWRRKKAQGREDRFRGIWTRTRDKFALVSEKTRDSLKVTKSTLTSVGKAR